MSRISKEVLIAARTVRIKDFCDMNGITLKQEDKHGNYRFEGFGGLIIKDNYYVHFADNKQGGNSIDFVQKVLDCTFVEAVEKLTNQRFEQININPPMKQKDLKKQVYTPSKSSDNKRAIAYLVKTRGIDYQIVKDLIQQGLIYQDDKNNVVFLWVKDDEIVGYNSRGTTNLSNFKQNGVGSDFSIGFQVKIGSRVDKVLIFEAPIDLLSMMTIKKRQSSPLNNVLLIATCNLNSEPMVRAANEYPNAELFICYDNDTPAKEFLSNLNLGKEFTAIFPKGCKDWNEVLLN